MIANPSPQGGIYIALGANLASPVHGPPRQTLEAALARLAVEGVTIVRRSSWWRSAPFPAADQPDFVNGVVEVDTPLDPPALLDLLHRIEADFGRVRLRTWEARILDLDLLDFRGQVRTAGAADGPGAAPVLPHPRLAGRLFVLLPLQEVAPGWRHPVGGEEIGALIGAAFPLDISML
ncbi:2-amino-4-hydroxy-6-hydroxymethyldihydropteridine diphosphokinase [Ferrovibrio sp.]|uniref:2-amino-4-hydroxy-6- hydroxymethyldihydropteridine diphosphokinase n=1 Tax=Ferrovibrio sp. TaxID=1917215 RepID=UPI0031203F31